MLENVWFFAITLLGFACNYHYCRVDREQPGNDSNIKWMLFGTTLNMFSMVFIWERIVLPIFSWWTVKLPETDTPLNWISALVITMTIFLFIKWLFQYLLQYLKRRYTTTDRGETYPRRIEAPWH
jgi:hypothetical protein